MLNEKVCKPIELRKWYTDAVKYQISRYLYDVLFLPLKDMLSDIFPEASKDIYLNAADPSKETDPVILALNKNQIRYSGGGFEGKFTARISRRLRELGAKYNRKAQKFYIAEKSLTIQIRTSIINQRVRLDSALKLVSGFLKTASENIEQVGPSIELGEDLDDILLDVAKQFNADLPANVLAITPELTSARLKDLKVAYIDDINRSVKDFTLKQTAEMREMVQEYALGGMRADTLEKKLIARWGISQRKAEFLAKQETSLLLSSYDESRAKEAGIDEYIWQTAGDGRVREEHKRLNGTRQRYDDPPIVDYKTGRHANPGQDYGCRCVARKIVKW